MKPEIREAGTALERDDVYRFRYEIYVSEMGRYQTIADHERRMLVEAEDATSRLYSAIAGGQIVGCMRHNWGGDAEFSDRHLAQYSMPPFLEHVPPEQIIVGERFMVAPKARGTDLIFRLFRTYLEFVNRHRIQLIFGDCEPHLLNLYLGMGFRSFAAKNVSSPETGYLIPLVMVPEDIDYMRRINSPLVGILTDFGSNSGVPPVLPDLIGGGAVLSQALTEQEKFLGEISRAVRLADNPVHLFEGLSEDEQRRCLKKSNAIECMAGDHLIKKGNVAQNMFVVLSGALEIRRDGELLAVCGSGDIVGEMAFLLESPRSADVFVAADNTRVLSLSESNLKSLIGEEPVLAAKLLLNLSKLLCHKVLREH